MASQYDNKHFLVPIGWMDLENMFFQQDGTTGYNAKEAMNLLRAIFRFFVWVFLKNRVYANNPRPIDKIKKNIHQVIIEIEPEFRIVRKEHKIMTICMHSGGRYLADIIYYMNKMSISENYEFYLKNIFQVRNRMSFINYFLKHS